MQALVDSAYITHDPHEADLFYVSNHASYKNLTGSIMTLTAATGFHARADCWAEALKHACRLCDGVTAPQVPALFYCLLHSELLNFTGALS